MVRLAASGRWRELTWRIRLRMHDIDLRRVTLDELGLPPDRAIGYSNSGGPDLDAVLRALRIGRGAAVVDLGCGKGGALVTLARHPFRRVTGVDLSPELLRVAHENMNKMELDHVDLQCVDAVEFDFDDYDYLYLYNPFPCNVVQAVMGNLADSIRRRPRRVTIIYNTPRCHDEIVANGEFEKVGEYPSGPSLPPFFVYVAPPAAAS
jgi:SAM-dependent methyltransferase